MAPHLHYSLLLLLLFFFFYPLLWRALVTATSKTSIFIYFIHFQLLIQSLLQIHSLNLFSSVVRELLSDHSLLLITNLPSITWASLYVPPQNPIHYYRLNHRKTVTVFTYPTPKCYSKVKSTCFLPLEKPLNHPSRTQPSCAWASATWNCSYLEHRPCSAACSPRAAASLTTCQTTAYDHRLHPYLCLRRQHFPTPSTSFTLFFLFIFIFLLLITTAR